MKSGKKQRKAGSSSLPPIVVSPEGEAVNGRFADSDPFEACRHVTGGCNGGIMVRTPVSKESQYDVLVCSNNNCKFRFYVPKSVRTFGDVRKHFLSDNP